MCNLDILIIIFFIIVAIAKGEDTKEDINVMEADGSISAHSHSSLPIGSNLELIRDPDAFMYIVKELGLR